jgi:hypothetical protein
VGRRTRLFTVSEDWRSNKGGYHFRVWVVFSDTGVLMSMHGSADQANTFAASLQQRWWDWAYGW